MNTRVNKLASFVVVLAVCAAAQAPLNGPTFRSGVEAVQVTAIVKNRDSRHVGKLGVSDFVLREDGKIQKIANVEEFHTEGRVAETNGDGRRYTNRLLTGPETPRLTIILLDLLATKFSDQAHARSQLAKFLLQWKPNEPVALLTMTCKGLELVQDFAWDPRVLLTALGRVKGSGQTFTPEDLPPVVRADPAAIIAQQKFEGSFAHIGCTNPQFTLPEIFQQLASSVAGVPGRKSLLWLSSGMVLTPTPNSVGGVEPLSPTADDISPQLEWIRAFRALADANIAMYPLDVSGLIARAPNFQDPLNPRTTADPLGSFGDSGRHEEMKQTALLTGGTAFYNRNDVAQGLQAAVDDSADFYVITYYRTTKDQRPGWHKLNVTVNQPGVKVRTRSGFAATGPIPMSITRDKDLSNAARSPIEFTGLSVSAEVQPEERTRNVRFEVTVPVSELEREEGGRKTAVDWLVLLKTEEGEIAQRVDGRSESSETPNETLTFSGVVQVPDKDTTYMVRFVARDVNSGRMGTLTIKRILRDPNRKRLPSPSE